MPETPDQSMPTRTRRAVKRPDAETYIVVSLIFFAVTVVGTRIFLEVTGYPQIGNSVLHIAHALWGGLFLFMAGLVPLMLANRWAFMISAMLSGVGVGLFIDEVGKFITQQNDYFFPLAAPLIYSTFLLMVLIFLAVRRSRQATPRSSMYHVLMEMGELLDNDLDAQERDAMLRDLAHARTSDDAHIALLANHLTTYLEHDSLPITRYRPTLWERLNSIAQTLGDRLGRRNHRQIILVIMAYNGLFALFGLIVFVVRLLPGIDTGLTTGISAIADDLYQRSPAWFIMRTVLQFVVGLLYGAAWLRMLRGDEQGGLNIAIFTSLLSITAVNLLTFYIDQFTALTEIGNTFVLFAVLLTYRSWYLISNDVVA